MNQATMAWAAFRNMLRAAARDPIWALYALLTAPFRLWKPLLGITLILFFVMLTLGFLSRLALDRAGLPHNVPLQVAADLATLLFLLALAFRFLTNPLIEHFGPTIGDTHGSARFASDQEVAPLTGTGRGAEAGAAAGLLIGRDRKTGRLLRYDGPAHLLTIAPTRSGKGVGSLLPNLLTADRSVLCIDPKGENARIAGRARRRFGAVHVLDPFEITGQPSAAFNPLDALDPDSLDLAEDAAALADSLVHDDPGAAGEAHWNEEAKALIAGLLLHIVTHDPPEQRTLATLRDHLTRAPDAFAALLRAMQASTAARGLVARAANRHLGKADREAAGVLSSAQRHTHFLDSPRMTAVLGHSDFRFASLKHGTVTVFLVLPPDRLGPYARWLRLLVAQALTALARDPARPPSPVLFLLDEFAALGHLAPVERAMGLMAGYGLQLWPVLQDLHQLRATYGQRAGTFLSNAGVLQVFGVNDHETARLVSDLLGQETVIFQTVARALDAEGSGLSTSEHHAGRPLLTPDEVRNLAPQTELLFLAGRRPVLATKLRHYEDPEFRGLYDPP